MKIADCYKKRCVPRNNYSCNSRAFSGSEKRDPRVNDGSLFRYMLFRKVWRIQCFLEIVYPMAETMAEIAGEITAVHIELGKLARRDKAR